MKRKIQFWYNGMTLNGDTLVSENGIFELGFFQPGSSMNRYLGIWFKKVSVRTVIWVANREHPLPGVSPLLLKVVDPGILVLFSNMSMIWSSNTTMTSQNATAKLQDSGNLVLTDQQERTIWQSFDYPTDTLLYGMKIGKDYSRGIEWSLSSWKNNQDPAPGEFTWSAETHGYPEKKLRQGSVVKFRGGAWSNQQVREYNKTDKNVTYLYSVVINEKEVSFSYYNTENSPNPERVTLTSAGELQYLEWIEDSKKWELGFQLPIDICDTYNICSAYGSCNLSMVHQACDCLDEKRFVPRDQKAWEKADWSAGCVRRTPLDCKNGSEGFIKYSNVKLPDTERAWFNMSITKEECKEKCQKNCSCMAYANPEIGFQANACLLWFDDLIDIRLSPQSSGGLDLFVRMASSELVAQSIFKKKGGTNIKIILLIIFPGLLLISVISIWIWYARRKRNHARPTKRGGVFHDSKSKEEDIQLPLFSFSTIMTATGSFSTKNILGEGGFGPVYKGVLEEGTEIAVKRLSRTSNQGVDEFKNEVVCISKLQHRNLVKLLGCCINEDENLLIYEYMANKSLDSFIFDQNKSMLLDWSKRLNIIKGIARGLLYLHHDSRLRIIHRDLKAGNVLLDLDMHPKISDFGLARSFKGNETQANTKRVVGTHGYMSPEYVLDGLFSIKSDVFSYGVLVLEIVSGKRNRGFVHPEHNNNLIGHVWSVYKEGKSMELIDACLEKSCHPHEVLRSIQVGLLCVQQNAEDRPTMPSVVQMLDGVGALPQPKQPAFFLGKDLQVVDSSSSNNPANSINDVTNTHLDGR
uniref:G-type lectin S-receptor-like serine/threonine-protein kinase At4g27290 n=1 Tax=Erigeron canadensis TaxID=72917 RepID=UPI001CB9D492|nr:G-type lectin S-receptor-like serine/threonine-protein kinase At4g27290 [Erigeron canadensis]